MPPAGRAKASEPREGSDTLLVIWYFILLIPKRDGLKVRIGWTVNCSNSKLSIHDGKMVAHQPEEVGSCGTVVHLDGEVQQLHDTQFTVGEPRDQEIN